MAYADFEFYSQCYHGRDLSEVQAVMWLDRASDSLDTLTFGRLISAFPTEEVYALRVKKAVCAMAEALYWTDVQRKAASSMKAEDGSYRGPIASMTSGKESISFAAGNGRSSAYAAAAADIAKEWELLSETACMYLANVADANGINLLYGGMN